MTKRLRALANLFASLDEVVKVSTVDPVRVADGDRRKVELSLMDHHEVDANVVLEIATNQDCVIFYLGSI